PLLGVHGRETALDTREIDRRVPQVGAAHPIPRAHRTGTEPPVWLARPVERVVFGFVAGPSVVGYLVVTIPGFAEPARGRLEEKCREVLVRRLHALRPDRVTHGCPGFRGEMIRGKVRSAAGHRLRERALPARDLVPGKAEDEIAAPVREARRRPLHG